LRFQLHALFIYKKCWSTETITLRHPNIYCRTGFFVRQKEYENTTLGYTLRTNAHFMRKPSASKLNVTGQKDAFFLK